MASAELGTAGLVGRDRELAQLRGWLAEALGGAGRLAVLTGPPGIGKTRLAEELASTARSDGLRALWGRAVDDEAAPPLWPWRRVLNTLAGADTWARITGGEVAAEGSSDDLAAARYRAAADAADALTAAAEQAGLLIVLEDLQWADLTSLFLLRELAGNLRGSRLLVVATCRDVAGAEWRQSLGDLARLPGLQLLRLGALRAADVTGILGAAGVSVDRHLAELVQARSEGNPLYVSTLARVLADSPATALDTDAVARIVGSSAEVSHLVTALLRGLDPEISAAVAAASVLGGDFTPDLVTYLCGTAGDPASALSAAAASGLVAPVPGRPGWWRFTHALLRDGVYASRTEAERTGLHRRAAAALAAAGRVPRPGMADRCCVPVPEHGFGRRRDRPDLAARRDHPAAADPLAPAAPAGVPRGAHWSVRPGQRPVLGGLPAGPQAPGSVRSRPVARVRGQPGHLPRRSSGNSSRPDRQRGLLPGAADRPGPADQGAVFPWACPRRPRRSTRRCGRYRRPATATPGRWVPCSSSST